MTARVIVDTGPLVALLDRRDRYHEWAKTQVQTLEPPLDTTEVVLGEACFLLRSLPIGIKRLLSWVESGMIRTSFRLDAESQSVSELMTRYSNVPMSLADACLVRMSVLHAGSIIFTIDSDFRIYRQHGRRVIPTIMPEQR